jgi:hypothetical protein
MAPHSFKIKVGETPFDAKIELDGRELTGVRRLSFELNPNDLSVLMLEIIGEIEVEGQFKDAAIVQVRQPARD